MAIPPELAASRIAAHVRGKIDRGLHGHICFDIYDVVPPPPLPDEGGAIADDIGAITDEQLDEEAPVYRSADILSLDGSETRPVQVGGHGMLTKDASAPSFLRKEVPRCEMAAYASVQGTELEELFAEYGGHEELGALFSIKLRDMTAGMVRPCVMDIKMGKRTFLESEVKNTKLRPDLAVKMAKIDRGAVTEEELHEGITKLRYMQFREARSSSAEFGFRIEGAMVKGMAYPGCKEIQSAAQITNAIHFFLQSQGALKAAYVDRLVYLRSKLDSSAWFQRHEVVGSSILFVYDDGAQGMAASAEAKMIDFAKTEEIPEGQALSHRSEWVVGNREDGYLAGLDSLIEIFSNIEVVHE